MFGRGSVLRKICRLVSIECFAIAILAPICAVFCKRQQQKHYSVQKSKENLFYRPKLKTTEYFFALISFLNKKIHLG